MHLERVSLVFKFHLILQIYGILTSAQSQSRSKAVQRFTMKEGVDALKNAQLHAHDISDACNSGNMGVFPLL